MYCKKCSSLINENYKYCHNCGSEISNISVNKDKTVHSIVPQFSYLYKISKIILIASVFLIISFLSFAISNEKNGNFDIFVCVNFIVLTGLIIVLICELFYDKMRHKHLKYNFYHNKVECVDNFLNNNLKILKYENIREVSMSQGILEKMCGIGTIRLYTSASSNMNGIYIHCVKNVFEEYETIKKIINVEKRG